MRLTIIDSEKKIKAGDLLSEHAEDVVRFLIQKQ